MLEFHCAYGVIYKPSKVLDTVSLLEKKDSSEDLSSEQKPGPKHRGE